MDIRRKPGFAAVFLAASVFLLQNCATIVHRTTQRIAVTATFIGGMGGAKVFVNGKLVGTTPLMLKLAKKRPAVIRIEKDGYNSSEIRIKRDRSFSGSVIMGNLLLGPLVGFGLAQWLSRDHDWDDHMARRMLLIAVISTAAFIGVDSASGAGYSLSPEALDVVLTRVNGTPRADMVEIDAARLRDVKWLRIRTAGPCYFRTIQKVLPGFLESSGDFCPIWVNLTIFIGF